VRSSRAETFSAMVARSSRTTRYSSANLGLELGRLSQLCIDVHALLRGGGWCAWPRVLRCVGFRVLGGFSVASPCHVRAIGLVVDDHHEALMRGVVASGVEVIGVAEPVVRGVEEPLEHYRVWHAGEVPLRAPMRGGGRQLASRAVVGLVVGGGDDVPDRQEVVPGKIFVCCHVGAGKQGVRRRGVAHPVGEPRLGNYALPRGRRRRLADGRVAL
jgi:hypothetical protein